MRDYPTISVADMNRRERATLRRILKASDLFTPHAVLHGGDSHRPVRDPKVELKRFELQRIHPKAISVSVEVGRKGDEGTMAEIFCRERFHGFVGPRGGLKPASHKKGRKSQVTARQPWWGWVGFQG
jgi:hypothetical protein